MNEHAHHNASTAASPHRQLLSVIIPAYNTAHTLGDQLDALRAQVYDGDWEIVVVDNRSNDNTSQVVQEYQHRMSHLRLVSAPEKQGRAYARNTGAREARGSVFLFCDADDIVAPGWLAALADALKEHDVVAGSLEEQALNQSSAWRPTGRNTAVQSALDFLPFAPSGNMAITREAFEAVDGFCEEFPSGQDVDISWRLQLRGYHIHFEPAAVIHYRFRKTRWEMFKQTVRYAEAHVRLYKRFRGQNMPRSSTLKALRRYKSLLKRTPWLWDADPQKREIWLRNAASYLGRLWGSLRHRTLYL